MVGLDQFGNSQTEVLTAGAANVTVTSTKVFSKISSIKSANSSSSTITVGTQSVGNLSINSKIGGSTFTLDSNYPVIKLPNLKIKFLRYDKICNSIISRIYYAENFIL